MNYYEILEVSEKASKEIIDKAYKTLAKRYHPDLQPEDKKSIAEEKMKQINEAYDILSDDNKRREFDNKLLKMRQIEENEKIQRTVWNERAKNDINQFVNRTENNNNVSERYDQNNRQTATNNNINYSKFSDGYNYGRMDNRKNPVYREKSYFENMLSYKLRQLKELFLTIVIMIGIIWLVWIFPLTHNLLIKVYNENFIIKALVDAVISIFWHIAKMLHLNYNMVYCYNTVKSMLQLHY